MPFPSLGLVALASPWLEGTRFDTPCGLALRQVDALGCRTTGVTLGVQRKSSTPGHRSMFQSQPFEPYISP